MSTTSGCAVIILEAQGSASVNAWFSKTGRHLVTREGPPPCSQPGGNGPSVRQRLSQSQYFLLLVLELASLAWRGLFDHLCALFQSMQTSPKEKKNCNWFCLE